MQKSPARELSCTSQIGCYSDVALRPVRIHMLSRSCVPLRRSRSPTCKCCSGRLHSILMSAGSYLTKNRPCRWSSTPAARTRGVACDCARPTRINIHSSNMHCWTMPKTCGARSRAAVSQGAFCRPLPSSPTLFGNICPVYKPKLMRNGRIRFAAQRFLATTRLVPAAWDPIPMRSSTRRSVSMASPGFESSMRP